jgi:hypothetical protein
MIISIATSHYPGLSCAPLGVSCIAHLRVKQSTESWRNSSLATFVEPSRVDRPSDPWRTQRVQPINDSGEGSLYGVETLAR